MTLDGTEVTTRGLVQTVRIRTDDWPERDRIAMFRELYGRDRIRIEPSRDEPLHIDALLLKSPDLGLLSGRRSPLRSEFTDGSDRLILNLGGPALATQFGREVLLERGDAIALSGLDRGTLTTLRSGRIMTLEFPQGRLLSLLKHPTRACARRIPKHELALRLLRGYVRTALAGDWIGAPALPRLVVSHIYDLAATALGAGREAQEIANGRGVGVARLRAIKDDLLAHLESDVSVRDTAARHRMSARYVGMLFESEGTTMTEFIRDERLKRARSMLLSPRYAHRRIAEIAYEVGFNDISYFNRSFRRRFGQSPSEMRSGNMPAPLAII